MKNVILAEPSTLALLGLGFFLLIFGVVAVLGMVAVLTIFLTRKARREAPPTSQATAPTEAAPKYCPKCGASMPPDSPEGLCPRCLIALNLATQTEIPGEPGAAKVPPGPPLPVGDIAKLFPQLEILECLGRGGMGAVYKVRQPRLDRLVALKILSPEKQGNQKFADRFEREARALAKLHHPNIVTVYDFGEVEGNFYLLMEYVDGLSLRQLLQSRKLSPPEALAIVPKICEALQYAHEQGIVHRDIKPENILMDKDGRVKIADFGIAKILGDGGSSHLTAEQVIGTPHYMSPEQIEKPQSVDHRADIYSLGVVFYEMLTGELPLGKFQPPSKKVQVDVRLDEVVLRALEKEPERRYQQVSEVKTRVETIASSGTKSSPASFSSTMSRFTVPALVVLGIIALVFFLNFRSSHLSSPENVAVKTNPAAQENETVSAPPTANEQNADQTQVDTHIIAEQPPVVVETFPVSGARDVAPGDTEIRVRFSKDMADGSWSWSTAWENSTPESLGPPHYLDDHRTCILKVHLEPGKTYAWWLNSGKFKGFTDAAGLPSVPYLFSFQTKQESSASSENNSFLTPTNHPKVISVSPADGATDVDPQQDIRIRFDQPMNPNDMNILWYSGGFFSHGQFQYDPGRNEFDIPLRLIPGTTNKLAVGWAGMGFRNTNSISADEFDWQFTTRPFAPKPGAPKPNVVQISPKPGETMSVLTLLEITFDQPMTLDYGFPFLRDRGSSFNLPGIVPDLHYDSSGRRLTIPLMLPPDNETKLTVEGFYNTAGVASDPMVVRCEIGTNNYSDQQLKSISTAAKDLKLHQLLSSMQAARARLGSGVETVTWISLNQEKGAFNDITTHSAIFKWQGTNQFYEDISGIMGPMKAFMLGSDGEICWLYGDNISEGRVLMSSPVAGVADFYASIADPFNLARDSVQSVIEKGKLVYEGQTQLDGRPCYLITSWQVKQTANEYFPVSVARTKWWIDSETFLPAQVVRYISGQQIYKFQYEGLNQPLPIAAFQPPTRQGTKSLAWFDKKLGPNETLFFKIKDGSDGQMSGRIGRRSPNGSTDSGLN